MLFFLGGCWPAWPTTGVRGGATPTTLASATSPTRIDPVLYDTLAQRHGVLVYRHGGAVCVHAGTITAARLGNSAAIKQVALSPPPVQIAFVRQGDTSGVYEAPELWLASTPLLSLTRFSNHAPGTRN